MLTHSFLHIPRSGKAFSKMMFSNDLEDWSAVLEWEPCEKEKKKACEMKKAAGESLEHLKLHDLDFFAEKLPPSETWRLFPYFRDRVCYLDIETTGLGRGMDYTTVATIYDGKNVMVFTHGKNMEDLPDVLENYKICVTFNGKCFDLPFLRSEFGRDFPLYQIDLRYVFASLGLKGGLKKLEKRFDISRGGWTDLDGYAAVLLWDWHRKGMKGALETLTAYNILDTVDLEKLMCLAYNLKTAELGGGDDMMLPEPEAVSIPYEPDRTVIRKALAITQRERFY